MKVIRAIIIVKLIFLHNLVFAQAEDAGSSGDKWGFVNDVVQKSRCLGDAKYALSIHIGNAYSHGQLKNITDIGRTVNLDVVFPIDSKWSWDLRLGYSSFEGKNQLPDVDIINFSANIAYAVYLKKPWLFVNAGPGLYEIDNANTEFGVNFGAGLGFPIDQTKILELTYNYHTTVTGSPESRFSKLQLGLLWSF